MSGVSEQTAVLAGERVAFTGILASMTHRQAATLVEERGGEYLPHVTQQTTLLVIGEEGWPLEPDGQPSVKLIQAQQLQHKGLPLRILSESEWLRALELEGTRSGSVYTPAMLSQLLDVPVTEIRRWERVGLIHPVRRVLRLPYFDFAEVSAARRLAELVLGGASIATLTTSLQRLRTVLPHVDRPLAQLQILSRGRSLLVKDPVGWLDSASGQRVFSFETTEEGVSTETEADVVAFPRPAPLQRSPEDWFREGCRLSEQHELTAAVEAFRLALIERPCVGENHFHLADTLYRQGNHSGAIERYYAAVEHDHLYLEAWMQLGCVLAEVGEFASAKDAFGVALDLHPELPDAHYHLAQVHEKLNDESAAKAHWERYLAFEARGPWAELARRRLESPLSRDPHPPSRDPESAEGNASPAQ